MRILLLLLTLFGPVLLPGQPFPPTDVERRLIEERAQALGQRIESLRQKPAHRNLLPDVEIYHKALVWILRDPEEFHRKVYAHDALLIAAAGMERAEALARGEAPWTAERGLVARGYRSEVDGSVQPYLVRTPADYAPSRPWRLDLILHGRNSRLNEVSFLADAERSHDPAAGGDRIELQVFGRTNNAYRWAGETDVFEALAATERNYRVDPARIVLRGFSMGGAGTWHLGLHHPDRWAAIEAGAGFTDTIVYAKNSLPSEIPSWQRAAMQIYDAADYALNSFNLPVVGYGGEDDPQLQASVNIREALAEDGVRFRPEGLNWLAPGTSALEAIFLVGPHTGHRFHPESKAVSEAFLARAAAAGLQTPDRLRFVTWTTAYPDCFWITVDGLERLYEETEVRAIRAGSDIDIQARNVSRLFVRESGGRAIRVNGQDVELPAQRGPTAYLALSSGAWRFFATADDARGEGLVKRPGLQGPIDDAFRSGFVVVPPQAGENDRLEEFRHNYSKFLRANLPETSAEAALAERDRHIVLFGDPSTNVAIAALLPDLPARWEDGQIEIQGQTFDAAGHTLAMIYPNPRAPGRYIVLNSGHTFGEKEFRGTNALLYPRLGDWAVLRKVDGQPVAAGFFDERWR